MSEYVNHSNHHDWRWGVGGGGVGVGGGSGSSLVLSLVGDGGFSLLANSTFCLILCLLTCPPFVYSLALRPPFPASPHPFLSVVAVVVVVIFFCCFFIFLFLFLQLLFFSSKFIVLFLLLLS